MRNRLAGLDAQRLCQFVGALGEAGHAVLQHPLAFERCEAAHRPGRRDGRGNGPVDGLGVGQRHAGGDGTAVLVADLQVGIGLLRAVGQVVGIAGLEHGSSG
jgi:hypothetical protein